MIAELALIPASFGASVLVTGLVLRRAVRRGVLDVPNARSSHTLPTPRGGGVAIVAAMTAAAMALFLIGPVRWQLFLALVVGGLPVACVGHLDDRRSVSVSVRFLVHLAAAVGAVWLLGGLPALEVNGHSVHVGWVGGALAVLGVVWTLNLFNFMDGIDGIAASEAVFVGGGGALASFLAANSLDVRLAASALAAACAGFLPWNLPKARIFMGDVGSGYLGYVVAVLALAATREDPDALWIWLVLGGVFFVDSTVTLIRRAARGEVVYEAHRSHAYQWLARTWGSHVKVTATVALINLGWLLPCALVIRERTTISLWMVALGLGPLAVAAAVSGAGRRESET